MKCQYPKITRHTKTRLWEQEPIAKTTDGLHPVPDLSVGIQLSSASVAEGSRSETTYIRLLAS